MVCGLDTWNSSDNQSQDQARDKSGNLIGWSLRYCLKKFNYSQLFITSPIIKVKQCQCETYFHLKLMKSKPIEAWNTFVWIQPKTVSGGSSLHEDETLTVVSDTSVSPLSVCCSHMLLMWSQNAAAAVSHVFMYLFKCIYIAHLKATKVDQSALQIKISKQSETNTPKNKCPNF